jgi:hypothetical protein
MTEKKPVGRSEDLVGEEKVQQDSAVTPSHEEIERLAYILWQARGRGDGEAELDWFEAERQLRVPEKRVHAA